MATRRTRLVVRPTGRIEEAEPTLALWQAVGALDARAPPLTEVPTGTKRQEGAA